MTLNQLAPWQQLAHHLRRPPPSLPTADFCHECRAELALFISDELAGQPVDTLYPEMAAHLDLCPTCLFEYEALSQLMLAALYGEEPANE